MTEKEQHGRALIRPIPSGNPNFMMLGGTRYDGRYNNELKNVERWPVLGHND